MLIERYILIEWAKVFFITLGLMLGLLILQIFYDDFEDLITFGASFQQILTYFIVQIPVFLPTVLPITFLLSILMGLGALHRNSEVVAMKASGIGLWQLSRGLWLMGLILSLVLLALSARVVPWSVEQGRIILDNLRFSSVAGQTAPLQDRTQWAAQLAFYNQAEDRTWFINHLNRGSFIARGITVHQANEAGVEIHRWEAREGFFEESTGEWVLLRGREILADPATGEPIQLRPFDRLVIKDWPERPDLMLALRQRTKDLSLFELESILSQLPPAENPISVPHAVRYQVILASPFACLMLVGIGVPFAISGVRTNPFVGASKSVGIFFAFYIVSNFSIILGERSWVSPIVAAWLPLGLLFVLGIWLFSKTR
jgi:lipopolysaccharide export system permease protein